jgi:hypothetical protein
MFSESADIKTFGLFAGMMAATMAMPSAASAISYTDVQALTLGGSLASGGVGAAFDGSGNITTQGATVYAGGSSSTVYSRIVGADNSANSAVSSTIQGTVALGSANANNDGSRLIRPGKADTFTIQSVTGPPAYTGNLLRSTGATVANNSGTNGTLTINGTQSANVDLKYAATGTDGKGGVRGVSSTVAGLKFDTTIDGSTGKTAGGDLISVGRNGYNAITVSGTLTTNLTLSGTRASNYFFVYLDGGMSSTGSITLGGATVATNVIVVSAAGKNVSVGANITTYGNYFMASGTTLTIGANATVDGGVFLSNTSTTPTELNMIANGALIKANPWSGMVMANAPEPVSALLFGTALAGLGLTARFRRRKA